MRATRRIWGAALTAAAALLALTGCNDDGSDASAPIVRPAATHSATPDAFPGMTARQILDRAISATQSASAVTINLRTKDDDDSTVHFTGALTKSGKCAAAMVLDSYHLQVIRTGATTYLKADAAFWKAKGGTHGSEMATVLAGKWLVMPKTKAGSAGRLCDLHGIMGMLSDNIGDSTLKKRGTVTVAGQQAVTLEMTDSDGVTDILVAAHGTPNLLRAFTPDDSSNDMTFTGYGETPHISPPPASQTLDLSAFGNPDISV